jgi:hypothetical protein
VVACTAQRPMEGDETDIIRVALSLDILCGGHDPILASW